jgi:serine/tyrosine/threonine adenylyltransferase
MNHSPIIYSLGSEFYDAVAPAHFPQTKLKWFNFEAAQIIGLSALSTSEIRNHFGLFHTFKSNIREPLALKYHGHQFRHYNPDIGDGRGFLLAQFLGNNKIYDLSTKGSGRTPYSRDGDGRLTLKGAVREILASEMLESLGVRTSRTFCVFETGENLERGDEPSPARSAVLTRMVHSSIRFGTFQRLGYLNHIPEMKKLVEYCLQNYEPELANSPDQRISIFFKSVMLKSADLAAQLMTAGFVHAVLNTDNMNITGEVFDFGPYRFLPQYNPYFTAAYFDRNGLYCYGRQPESFLWGLKQLGNSLKKIEPQLDLDSLLEEFAPEFNRQHKNHFFRRLNLVPLGDERDDQLIQGFYQMLSSGPKNFEPAFFDFFGGFERQGWKTSTEKESYLDSASLEFIEILKSFKVTHPSSLTHPYFLRSKPETLLIQDVEKVWASIALRDDWGIFEQKIKNIRSFRGAYMSAPQEKHNALY